MSKKNSIQDENLENVQEALTTSGQWIEKNQNLLLGILGGIVLVVVAILAINYYLLTPKNEEASTENARADVYFRANDFEKALNGDESDCIGFAQIVDDYGFTKAGKLAAFYAGVCEYKLGEYAEAIKYLRKYNCKDVNFSAAAKQLEGDANVELGEYAKALACYEKVARKQNNIYSPISLEKAGKVALKMENKKVAAKYFEQIKEDYPMSYEAQNIDKLIQMAK